MTIGASVALSSPPKLRKKMKKVGVKKGKKNKFNDPLTKKRKGLPLNQTERRIIRKQKKKQETEAISTSNRKRLLSSSDAPSGEEGDSPKQVKKSKRVSFSAQLEQMKSLDSFDDSMPLDTTGTTPSRGILKQKKSKSKPLVEKKKKKKIQKTAISTEPVSTAPTEYKQRPTIQVKKSVKEKLLALPRKERKAYLRELRAKRKPNIELATRCIQLWETIRSGRTDAKAKQTAIEELAAMVKGKAKSLIYAHDTCRAIECLLKWGGLVVKAMLFDELKPELVRMAKSKYARFFVKRMLKRGTSEQRAAIMTAFRGHYVALLRTDASSLIVETAYNDYANAKQRSDILCEFYGREFVHFQTPEAKSLNEIIQAEPAKKNLIVRHLEELLKDIAAKRALKHSIVHRLLGEFFQFCNSEQRSEMIDSLKERVVEILHTPDGNSVALQCIWYGTAKDRKVIIKSLKGVAAQTAKDAYGSRLLLAIFDSVDDTKIVNKYIVEELGNNIADVLSTEYGVNVIQYLCHPRNPRVFKNSYCKLFVQGDESGLSKKSSVDRYSQLWEAIAKPLLTYLAANMRKMITGAHTALLILAALEANGKHHPFVRMVAPEDRLLCYKAIAEIAAEEFIPCNHEEGFHVVEDKRGHFVIKMLLLTDAKLDVKLGVELARLPREQLGSWVACNKGCFILVAMLDTGSKEATMAVRSAVSPAMVKRYSTKGAQVLLNKLQPVSE